MKRLNSFKITEIIFDYSDSMLDLLLTYQEVI